LKPRDLRASGEEELEIKYEHIASYFDNGKRAPQKLTIIPQDNLEGAHSTGGDQGLESFFVRGDPQNLSL